ncbi:aspartate ammonia-lyase [Thermosipho affectus]|uniref:Aspartate ammonia-lyase n=1 Tax=Thermosipho affectus TaxID=660294 RepID=A0ABX3IFV5_9BACT|nr:MULTISPECIES: aspartate ammonia-lyase [Thermosipho]ANQ54266.1 aspartate ammonia-lyase [Thermosipho sp. 1070]APT72711.1 aspartate ammonia-lyase [Thermosipho sp. 1063]ONN26705.1 aspartate ammonia-lyase [Thermosipho affectus]OOC42102.1 aspartate ammonia-lyase [Thermosipho sp. 1074]
MRKERDYLGEIEIEDNALYGISSKRATQIFPNTNEKFDKKFLWAYFMIKKAAAKLNTELGYLEKEIGNAIEKACDKWEELLPHIIVDPLSGGAGTSVNMNINEVIANKASIILGKEFGFVNPLEHVNMHQSTNDTFVTAGKIAIIVRLRELIDKIINLQNIIQQKEKEYYSIRKVGRTQLMDGPPIMLGQEFGAFADALARDRWRLNKVEERIRNVNIGGTAIGTGIGAPKEYILKIVNTLRETCCVKIAKAENLIDTTQNMDVFSEIHGLLKALAVNLYKISNDIRLLGSGPNTAIGELILPKVQIGSSIMPGKINPVIPEYVMQISLIVFSHDSLINHAASLGNLELNQFSPIIIHYTLKSLKLLKNACISLSKYISKIEANEKKCKENLEKSISNLTPLINLFGYEEVANAIKKANYNFFKAIEILSKKFNIPKKNILEKIDPKNLTKLGF